MSEKTSLKISAQLEINSPLNH